MAPQEDDRHLRSSHTSLSLQSRRDREDEEDRRRRRRKCDSSRSQSRASSRTGSRSGGGDRDRERQARRPQSSHSARNPYEMYERNGYYQDGGAVSSRSLPSSSSSPSRSRRSRSEAELTAGETPERQPKPSDFKHWMEVKYHSPPAGKSCVTTYERGWSRYVLDERYYKSRAKIVGRKVHTEHPGRRDHIIDVVHNHYPQPKNRKKNKYEEVIDELKGKEDALVDEMYGDRAGKLIKYGEEEECTYASESTRSRTFGSPENDFINEGTSVVPRGGLGYRCCLGSQKNRGQFTTIDKVAFNRNFDPPNMRAEFEKHIENLMGNCAGKALRDDAKELRAELAREDARLARLENDAASEAMDSEEEEKELRRLMKTPGVGMPLPTLFLSHGQGAMPLLWPPEHPYVRHFDQLGAQTGLTRETVKCIVILSAHWETEGFVEVTQTRDKQAAAYDYGGYPEKCFQVDYVAYGHHAVATRCISLLGSYGIPARANGQRSLDHGVFVPLSRIPAFQGIPLVQISLPAQHSNQVETARFALKMGEALAPLRNEGCLIVGSGQAVNPHKKVGNASQLKEFVEVLKRLVTHKDPATRYSGLEMWAKKLPHARMAHGRAEHLLPLLVCAAAAKDAPGHVLAEVWEGTLAMVHFIFGE